jgi:hypothetical protein
MPVHLSDACSILDQRAHLNRNIRFRFKVKLFQQDTVKESRQQTSNCSMIIGSLTQ